MPQMFDIRRIVITDEDIQWVESIFGFAFNEEQKKVIRHWDSADIQACPGSGKTTTLAAKLLLLPKKLPVGFQKGICVITHTNIAVKEIENKIGGLANFYKRYPNHFGTIQSFVDKYLTIPSYKEEFKRAPKIVDNATYLREIRRYARFRCRKTLMFLDAQNVEIGYLCFNKHNFNISKTIHKSEPIILNIKPEKWAIHFQQIAAAKNAMLNAGYIKYDEAYAIAFRAMRNNATIKEIIRLRFPLVFIDEMQDMESHQSKIVCEVFDKEKVVVQKIGDINQAIYGHADSEDISAWEPLITPSLQLTHSTRIAENLAKEVKEICLLPQQMIGWDNSSPLKPTIMLYDAEKILKVKDAFGKLIITSGLNPEGIFKCIGSRVSESRLNINSYWPEYRRERQMTDLEDLDSYLVQIKQRFLLDKDVKEVRRQILEALCRFLKLNQIKNPTKDYFFTPTTLFSHFAQGDLQEKNSFIDSAISEIIIKGKVLTDVKQDLTTLLYTVLSWFSSERKVEGENFLSNPTRDEVMQPANKLYKYQQGEVNVNLEFDTIHGVKGETHTATLYLECYSRVYDVGEKILKFITSDEKHQVKLRREAASRRQLPLAYVALTRATHLFAIALDKSRFNTEYRTFFDNNKDKWNVMDVE